MHERKPLFGSPAGQLLLFHLGVEMKPKRKSQKEMAADFEEELRHREAMLRAVKQGIAGFYRNPEGALRLMEEYLQKAGDVERARQNLIDHFEQEAKMYEVRMKMGVPPRQQRLGLLEALLFPRDRAKLEKGHVPGAAFMDAAYHGTWREWS